MSAESDALDRVKNVLDAYWTTAIMGQTLSGDWLYGRVWAAIDGDVVDGAQESFERRRHP